MEGLFQPLHLLVLVIIVGFVIVPLVWVQIFPKAGYSGWLAILIFIPLVNVITLFWFAFSKWPIQSEVEQLRAKGGAQIQL